MCGSRLHVPARDAPYLKPNAQALVTTELKSFPNFFYYFFKMKFRQNKFFCIWKIFEIFFGKWKKIHFCSENWGFFVDKKVAPIFIIFFLICSLDKINLLKFGKFGIRNVPIGKKSTFVPKIEDFLRAKKFSDFFFYFFRNKAQVK